MWVVYNRPRDYPHGYVARLHLISASKVVPTAKTLCGGIDVIRRAMQQRGLVRLARDASDDPVIVESWV